MRFLLNGRVNEIRSGFIHRLLTTKGGLNMKLRALFAIFLIISLAACSSTKQTVIADEVIFYGEGKYWNVKYIYNPELYDEKK